MKTVRLGGTGLTVGEVGFGGIPIQRLEGKWKLNQNRPAEQRARVIERLQKQADENSLAIATAMQGMMR